MSPLLEEKRKVMLCQGIEDRTTSLSKVIEKGTFTKLAVKNNKTDGLDKRIKKPKL